MRIRLTVAINGTYVRDLMLPIAAGYEHFQNISMSQLVTALDRLPLPGDIITVTLKGEPE